MYCHKNKITLRKIDNHDLFKLFKLKEESWENTHNTSILNMSDQEKWFDKISSSNTDLCLMALYNNEEIGIYFITDINWINQSCNFSVHVFKEFRSKGHGKNILEAGIDFTFEILNMRRISTEILESNKASLKMEEAFEGSVKEGIRRKAVYKSGNYIDSIIYGMLRDEWMESIRVKKYEGKCYI